MNRKHDQPFELPKQVRASQIIVIALAAEISTYLAFAFS
jgi:hypothetical protein